MCRWLYTRKILHPTTPNWVRRSNSQSRWEKEPGSESWHCYTMTREVPVSEQMSSALLMFLMAMFSRQLLSRVALTRGTLSMDSWTISSSSTHWTRVKRQSWLKVLRQSISKKMTLFWRKETKEMNSSLLRKARLSAWNLRTSEAPRASSTWEHSALVTILESLHS